MSAIRDRIRSRLTRPSTRAIPAPGQVWIPRPNVRCSRTLGRSRRNSSGFSNWLGSRLAAPGIIIMVVPAGVGTSPTVVVLAANRKWLLIGLSSRRVSSRKFGIRLRSSRSCCCRSGRSPSDLQCERQHLGGGFLAGGEQEGRQADDVDDLGHRFVGILGLCQDGEHISAGFTAPVLDVGGEPVLEELQRIVHDGLSFRHVVVTRGHTRHECVVVFCRYAQEVGDHEQSERLCELTVEFAAARLDERVELLVGQRPHELFVLLEAPRRQQPAEQTAGTPVLRRVENGHEVAERHVLAMLDDLVGDVVALGRERQRSERTCHRVACRESLDVLVDGHRRVIAQDRHHPALIRIDAYRALGPPLGDVAVRVNDQRPGRTGTPWC